MAARRSEQAAVAGLRIIEFSGGGIEEAPSAEVRTAKLMPTIARGVLVLPEALGRKPQTTSLLGISGRRVMELHSGANDVSRLSPGVYFVRDENRTRKVVIQR